MARKIIGLYNQIRGIVEFSTDRELLQKIQTNDEYMQEKQDTKGEIISVVSIEDGMDDDVETSTNDVFCVTLIRIDACIELSKTIYAPIFGKDE